MFELYTLVSPIVAPHVTMMIVARSQEQYLEEFTNTDTWRYKYKCRWFGTSPLGNGMWISDVTVEAWLYEQEIMIKEV